MTTVTRDELRVILGDDLDERTLRRIAATGASLEEVADALGFFVADECGDECAGMPCSVHVLEVRAILHECVSRNELDESPRHEMR